MFKNKAMVVLASALFAMPAVIQAQGVTPTAGGKGGTVGADQIIQRYTALAGSEANAKSLVHGLRTGSPITLTGEGQTCSAYEQSCSAYQQSCSAYEQTCTQVSCAIGSSPDCVCPVGQTMCFAGVRQQCTNTSTCKTWQNTSICKTWQDSSTCKTWQPNTTSATFSAGPAAPMGFGNVDIALALTEAALRPVATPKPKELEAKLMEILGKRAGGEGWGEIAKSYGFELK